MVFFAVVRLGVFRFVAVCFVAVCFVAVCFVAVCWAFERHDDAGGLVALPAGREGGTATGRRPCSSSGAGPVHASCASCASGGGDATGASPAAGDAACFSAAAGDAACASAAAG
ncbi:hypothetical protein JQK87_32485, partial [Streptomyces sp. G44]|nr:hypothetical protein [Streptomyces sp. G44]